MSPVHLPDAPATRPPAYGSQYVVAGRGATENVVPLLGKFVHIL